MSTSVPELVTQYAQYARMSWREYDNVNAHNYVYCAYDAITNNEDEALVSRDAVRARVHELAVALDNAQDVRGKGGRREAFKQVLRAIEATSREMFEGVTA